MKRRPTKIRPKRPGSGAPYAIGYGRPPKATRFRPGQTGNPAGRPTGSRNTSSLAKLTLDRRITVEENGRRHRMSVRELACLRLAEKAMSGDLKAIDYLFMLANERQQAGDEGAQTMASTEEDIKAIRAFLAQFGVKLGEKYHEDE